MGKMILATLAAVLVMVFVGFTGDVSAQTAKKADTKKAAAQPAQPAQAAPQAQQPAPVKTIFDYKKEVGYTDEQESKMKAAVSAFNEQMKGFGEKLKAAESELKSLFEKNADMKDIEKKVREHYDLRASIEIANIELSRKINAVLTPEQTKKWREIQAQARKK